MNSELPAGQKATPESINPLLPAKRRHIPNLFGCIFMTFAVLVLGGLLWPASSQRNERIWQTKALMSAKQIGLALKLFAEDHDGNFPRQGFPVEMHISPTNSNEAFACLFPTQCTAEKLFYIPASTYASCQPDEVCDDYTGKPGKTLEPGENVYGYVMGLKEQEDPMLPLIVDGTDGSGHYVTDSKKRGGVWKGTKAIVIYVDDSGAVEKLAGPDNARYIPRAHDDPTHNLLDPTYLNAHHARLLDPAVAVGH